MRRLYAGESIVVTGLGVVVAGAEDPEGFWDRAAAGRDSASLFQLDPDGDGLSVGVVRAGADLTSATAGIKRGKRLDRSVKMALRAAGQAVTNAALFVDCPPVGHVQENLAVVVGTSRGPVERFSEGVREKSRKGRVRPSLASESTPASLSGAIGARFGAGAACYTVSSACSAGAHAICLGADYLLAGNADIAIVGGADAPLLPFLVRQFYSTGILDLRLPPVPVCTPFDVGSSGTLLGEGAGFLVLESASHAEARGATIQARLSGWGLAADGCSSSPEAAGGPALRRSAARALARAGISADMLGYINLHGTGTALNDSLELAWVREMQEKHKGNFLYGSTKPVTGHCLGATSAMEAVLSVLSLQKGQAPPSANCFQPSPNAPPGLVLREAHPLPGRYVMSTSLGFWGASASLIFSR